MSLPSAAPIESAFRVLRDGRPIIVFDDVHSHVSALVASATTLTKDTVATMIRHGSGIISVPLLASRLEELELTPMVVEPTDRNRGAFTISVDHRRTSTGISAHDRWMTIRSLVDPSTLATDLTRPGHIYPIRYEDGGVLRRPRHAEAAVDLVRGAGLYPAAALTVILDDETGNTTTNSRSLTDSIADCQIQLTDLLETMAGDRQR